MNELVGTQDFYTIALIHYFEHEIDRVENDNGRKTVWIRDTDEWREQLRQYSNNKLMVKARKFKAAIEDTKELLHR